MRVFTLRVQALETRLAYRAVSSEGTTVVTRVATDWSFGGRRTVISFLTIGTLHLTSIAVVTSLTRSSVSNKELNIEEITLPMTKGKDISFWTDIDIDYEKEIALLYLLIFCAMVVCDTPNCRANFLVEGNF